MRYIVRIWTLADVVAFKKAVSVSQCMKAMVHSGQIVVVNELPAKTIERTSLSLQSIDNVHGSNGLPFRMLCVCDCITDDVLQEDFEHTSCFFIDQA